MPCSQARLIPTFTQTRTPFYECSESRLSSSLGHVIGFAVSETRWNMFASQDTPFEIRSFTPKSLSHLARSEPSLLLHNPTYTTQKNPNLHISTNVVYDLRFIGWPYLFYLAVRITGDCRKSRMAVRRCSLSTFFSRSRAEDAFLY